MCLEEGRNVATIPIDIAAELVGASSVSALYQFLWWNDNTFKRIRGRRSQPTQVSVADLQVIHATMYNAQRRPHARRSRRIPTLEQKLIHNDWFDR